jgi:hypothetical protein
MKLSVALNNLGPNQLAYNVIKNFNKASENQVGIDFLAFYENFSPPCFAPNFAVMQIYEGWSYNGIVVATSLSTASKALSFPSSAAKFFYVWDLEWIRMKHKYAKELYSIYRNPNLKLIARSKSHKNLIEDCWNTKVVGIVDDFNLNELLLCLQN